MKFVLACYGTRGDVEPFAAVGRELQRRGHDVRMAVPPNLVGFAEAAGLAAAAYGPDTDAVVEVHQRFSTCASRSPWRVRELIRLWREAWLSVIGCWGQMSTTLTSLADGADLLFTALGYERPPANVAEYYDIPLAMLHHSPLQAKGELMPSLPTPLSRAARTLYEWVYWRMTRKYEDAQRRELGLPKATGPSSPRIAERGPLEIQAYDPICFPGLVEEWGGRRPFVGTLTMQLTTDTDDEVESWIAAGPPPILFGFGSIPVESPADTVAMISAACAELGERALLLGAGTDFSRVPPVDNVKVVGLVNFATTFPACRALVHHGGTGTTAASLRAGIPTLVLWASGDQPLWGARVERLKVGAARRFSATTQKTLVADLRRILAPQYAARAREVASQMSKPGESVANAADLLEDFARSRRESSRPGL